MVTTLKFKLYKQNRNHQKRLNQYLYTAANVYNHCIALHKRHYALYGKGIKESKLKNHMAKLRRSESYSHWQMLTAQTVQDIVERIALSYKSFFNKTAKHLPGFKSSKFYSSITYKQDGYALNGNELTIRHSNLRLRFFKHREIDGKIKQVRLLRDKCNDWWLLFVVEKDSTPTLEYKTNRSAGFDFGLHTFLTSSDAESFESPRFFFDMIDKMRTKSRNLSKCKYKSNGRKKKKLELARLHRSIKNKRDNFQWNLAVTLVRKYDILCFEDLVMTGMMKRWGRKISDLSFSSFISKVKYLADKYNKKIKFVDRFAPTSKLCSHCGTLIDWLTLDDRVWQCPTCHTTHDRDINAAINIKRIAMQQDGRK